MPLCILIRSDLRCSIVSCGGSRGSRGSCRIRPITMSAACKSLIRMCAAIATRCTPLCAFAVSAQKRQIKRGLAKRGQAMRITSHGLSQSIISSAPMRAFSCAALPICAGQFSPRKAAFIGMARLCMRAPLPSTLMLPAMTRQRICGGPIMPRSLIQRGSKSRQCSRKCRRNIGRICPRLSLSLS